MPSRCQKWEKEFQALMGPLSPPCRDYAAIVFFANNRFETGKKKLQYLSFGDFAFCAELMIQNWTLGAVGEAPPAQVPGHLTFSGPGSPQHLGLQAPVPSSLSSLGPPQPPADKGPTASLWLGASRSASDSPLAHLSVSTVQ